MQPSRRSFTKKPTTKKSPAVDMTPEKAQDLLRTFDENEDKNYHSENAKLLADNFGTPEQQKKMNEILDRHQKSSTGISDEDYNWRNKNINPLYQKLVEASKPKQSKPKGLIGDIQSIVDERQSKKIDGQIVDVQTANAIMQVYNALNDENVKATMEKLPVKKLATVAWSIVHPPYIKRNKN